MEENNRMSFECQRKKKFPMHEGKNWQVFLGRKSCWGLFNFVCQVISVSLCLLFKVIRILSTAFTEVKFRKWLILKLNLADLTSRLSFEARSSYLRSFEHRIWPNMGSHCFSQPEWKLRLNSLLSTLFLRWLGLLQGGKSYDHRIKYAKRFLHIMQIGLRFLCHLTVSNWMRRRDLYCGPSEDSNGRTCLWFTQTRAQETIWKAFCSTAKR